MNIRVEKWGINFHFSLTRMSRQIGVNSLLRDGSHMLLWDFDNVSLEDITDELERLQYKHSLPTIYIVGTGIDGFYHAYCFARCSWHWARSIIAATEKVDKVFLAMGCLREYFTLRISKKKGRGFEPVMRLPSGIPEEVNPDEVKTISRYWTKRG